MSQQSSKQASTEPPSFLQQDLSPVKLKYIPLPAPLSPSAPVHLSLTATDNMLPPCRRCLQDAKPGEVLNLVAYDPFPVDSVTPYRGLGPIFVHARDCQPFAGDVLPEKQLRRLLSLRAYDENHMLAASDVVEGHQLEEVAGSMLADTKASYVNIHNASPGCFAVRAERA